MKSLIFGTALAVLASPALAADMIAPASTFDWSGPYLGAQIGYGWARDHIHDSSRSDGSSDYSDHFNMKGGLGGVFAGYNFQNGNLVYGAEADAEISDVSGDNPDWPFGDNTTAKITAQGSLRGRLGYAFNDSLVYATAGLAVANIKTKYFDGANEDSYSRTRAGWTLGVGAEHAFTPNWIARVEYRYTDFGSVTDWTRTTDSGYNEHNDITQHAVRIGLAYKF
ncbi:Porin [Mesorhizobium plurifarium]|uniref:Porin n=1 Tax=Mesorhizobium plurifarium TaxID=69974 RepID=A0A0K2VYK5_MESPL|nr:Porin [Mesorhizobium plurifarium]